MRPFSPLLLAICLFSSVSGFAQKSTLTLGAFALPARDFNVVLGSAAYYRPIIGAHILGLKATFITDAIGAAADYSRYSYANVDLVHRWTITKANHKYQWHLEAGLSAAGTFEKVPPFENWGYCGTGLSKAEMEEMERYYEEVLSKWHTNRAFYAGIATAASWELAISEHFGLGLGLMINTYFSPKNGLYFLPAPNLYASYTF